MSDGDIRDAITRDRTWASGYAAGRAAGRKDRDAELRAAVRNLGEASHQRVGPKGWRHIDKDDVLALLDQPVVPKP